MKTLILALTLLFAGFISGAAFQYTQQWTRILNLGNTVMVFQDGEPTILEFNDELLLRPGAELEVIGGL